MEEEARDVVWFGPLVARKPVRVTARTELQLQRYNDVLIERILNYRAKGSRECKLKYTV